MDPFQSMPYNPKFDASSYMDMIGTGNAPRSTPVPKASPPPGSLARAASSNALDLTAATGLTADVATLASLFVHVCLVLSVVW